MEKRARRDWRQEVQMYGLASVRVGDWSCNSRRVESGRFIVVVESCCYREEKSCKSSVWLRFVTAECTEVLVYVG